MHIPEEDRDSSDVETVESEKRRMFHDAIKNNNVGLVRAFLEDSSFSQDLDSYGLRLACSNGHFKIVKLLLDDGRYDPSALSNYAFLVAAKAKRLDILEILVSNPKFDPAMNGGWSLVNECIVLHEFDGDVIKILLRHPMVNPFEIDDTCLAYVYLKRNLEMFKILIRHPKFSMTHSNKYGSLGSAIVSWGNLEALKEILAVGKQSRLDLVEENETLFNLVAYHKQENNIKYLLEDDEFLAIAQREDSYDGKNMVIEIIENRIQRKAAGIWACKEIGQGWGDIADILQSRMVEY